MGEKRYDLVTFGEAMIRLSPPDHMRLEQTNVVYMSVGGAELNVAVNAAHLGLKTAWVSRLVDNWTGRYILNKGRERGVEMIIYWSEFDGVGRERNGFYHVELGAGPRASTVTYDRAYSAISNVKPGEIDWRSILSEAKWFHTTGITPALSKSTAEVTLEALRTACELGVKTSYDLNYRSKLWSPEEAQEVTEKLMPYVKVLFGNEEDFEKCLGLKAEGTTESYDALDPESYKEVARKVMEIYPNVELVGTTLRVAKTALLNDWRALLYDGERFYLSRVYENLEIVDRVGGGDSFAAGVIYCLLTGKPMEETIEFAAAYSALAHTFPYDFNWATLDEVERAMKGLTARIRR